MKHRTFLIHFSFSLLILAQVTFSCSRSPGNAGTTGNDSAAGFATPTAAPPPARELQGEEVAILKTRHGEITIRFFPELAPEHVKSFKKLAGEGFYNGTTFHRVIPNFMIQGGDPLSKDPNNRMRHGAGGPGYTLKAEFSAARHTRGIVSAARSRNPDSAGSQFFICVADVSHLDGKYTVFGQVVKGMDVVDKIVNEPRDGRDNPNRRVEMEVRVEKYNADVK